LVTAILIIAAALLGLSCQKEEPEQKQAAVKHSVVEESAQQQPLQAQAAPAQLTSSGRARLTVAS